MLSSFHHMQRFPSILVITTQPEKDLITCFDIDIAKQHVDTLVIRPDTSIGIDEVREIQSFATFRPMQRKEKTVVILDTDKMTPEAQNALLKILEEPPSYLTLILTAGNQYSLLDTVLSRCQIIHTPPTNAGHNKTEGSGDPFLAICIATPVPARLSLLPPSTKSREAAIKFCHQLVLEAEALLHSQPNQSSVTNLKLISECLDRLRLNANPTMALSDTILRLKK